jgi:hypothetical protein
MVFYNVNTVLKKLVSNKHTSLLYAGAIEAEKEVYTLPESSSTQLSIHIVSGSKG